MVPRKKFLYVSKPHVGTFRLVKIVEYLRSEIERLGGEIRFSTRVENIVVEAGEFEVRDLNMKAERVEIDAIKLFLPLVTVPVTL